jgi:hypothetical protein
MRSVSVGKSNAVLQLTLVPPLLLDALARWRTRRALRKSQRGRGGEGREEG